MELMITHIIRSFILPPGLFLSLLLLGFLLRLRFHRTGKAVMASAVVLLLLMSLPIVVNPLLHAYENIPALTPASLNKTHAKAIVILGGGRYEDAPEYGSDTVARRTLERIRYGAWLQRKTKLPILVTGGVVHDNDRPPEAALMRQVLEKEFLAVVPWVEIKSHTTYENAMFSYPILEKSNIKDIILVTHAIHMPRALKAFEKAGFNVTPAPMGFDTGKPGLVGLLPNRYALSGMGFLMYEISGSLWYHLRYY